MLTSVHLRHTHAYKRTTFLEVWGSHTFFLEIRFDLLFPILVYALICLLFAYSYFFKHYNIVNTSGIHAGSNKIFRGGGPRDNCVKPRPSPLDPCTSTS